MTIHRFFLYLFIGFPLLSIANQEENFLQEALCPTGDPNDLAPELRTAYDIIEADSTSWSVRLGICTPSKDDQKRALQNYVKNKSKEDAFSLLKQPFPGRDEYVEHLSAIIMSQLSSGLQQYETGYPWCGLLNAFLGRELRTQIATLVQQHQEQQDKKLIRLPVGNEDFTISVTHGLVRRLYS